MSRYRFLAQDLMSGVIRDEIPFASVTWGRVLNGAAPFSARISYRHAKATRANLDPSRTLILAERDGRIVGDGIVWDGRVSPGGTDLELSGASLWSAVQRRKIRSTLDFAQVDQAQIATGILDHIQGIAGGDLAIVYDAPDTGVLRDQPYPAYERKWAGESIEQIAARIDGFDFEVQADWDATRDDVVRTFYLEPQRGRDTNHVWSDQANTIRAVGTQVDGSRQANLVDALGAGEGDDMLIATAADPSQRDVYPLLEESAAHKDVRRFATLAGHAQGRLEANRLPLELPQLKVSPSGPPRLSTYIPGDIVTVRVDDGWMQFDGKVRITGYSVTAGEDSDEDVTLDLTTVVP